MKTPFFYNPVRALLFYFCCSLLVSGVTGCAFTRTPVKVTFAPSVTQPLKEVRKGALEVTKIKDTRLVEDPAVLVHKANEYGTTSGAYVTDPPVGEIFGQGLKQALQQNGFSGENGVHYELHAELQNFGCGAIQNGILSSLTAKPWLEVRFELVDKTTDQRVWHDTYTGQVTEKVSAWTGPDGDFYAKVFSEVAEDVVKQLIADKTFRNYFE